MNEQALQDAYSIFKKGGYNGDINEFFNLLKTNDRAKDDAFKLFASGGYNGDINSFSTLIGLDRVNTAGGGYIPDDYKEDANGRRNYLNPKTNKYELKEVGYDYDRSKGIRYEHGDNVSWGKMFDDIAYNRIKPFVEMTTDAINSSQSGDYTDAMNEMIIKGEKGMTEEKAAEVIELMRKQQEQGPSENIVKWAEDMEGEKNKVYGFLKATYNSPGAAYEAIISSMAGQLKATTDTDLLALAIGAGGTTAAAGSTIAPGVGTVAGFLRGFMSTMGGGVESASKFGELIVEEFDGQMPTEEELIKFLSNEEKFKKFRNKALAKGGTIALVDNIGGGLIQNSVFKTAKTGRKVLAATKGLVGEAIVGGGGEALSSTVIGDEVSAVDVGLEILGQGGQATVDVGSALITPGKYKIKGDKATLQQVNEILNTATPEEIANIDIEIKNDPTLEAEYNKKRQNGYLQTQVDPTVSDPKDRARAAELQIEKEQLEAKIKKGGIFKGVNTETKLESVNKEIDDIFNKYSPEVGPAVDPAGIEARTVVKDEAYKNRLQLLKDEITKGVKQTKFYRKANIKTEEATGDQAVDMFAKQEADNLGYDLTLLNNELSETTDAKKKKEITKKIAEVEAEIQALDENSKEAKNAHGFLLEDHATGEMTIVINTSKDISSAGNINVAAHELLHAVLRNTFLTETGLRARELKGTGLQTGQKLLDYLVENEETQLLLPGGIMDRLKSYAVKNEKGELEYGDTAGQEVLNLLSDAFVNVNYNAKNKNWWQGLGNRISDILQAYLPERYTNKLNFGDGKQVFDFIKTFNKAVAGDVVSGRIIERASRRGIDTKQKPTDEAAKTPMSKISSKGKAFLETKDDTGKLMFTNEMLVDIVNDKRSSQENKFGAVEALVEKNWPVISKALKFNPSGDITMESIKTAISEQMTGIFPKITLPNGQTVNREGKFLLSTYNRENTVTTFLDNTLRPRQAEIFTRAKMIDATSQGVSLDEAKNIAVSTELENATSNQQDTRKRTNVLKIPKVAKVAKEIKQDTKVTKGDTHKQVTKNNEGHVGNKIFNIPENKITKPNQNLTTSDEIVSIKTGEVITKEELDAGATGILSPSESKSVQDVFADYETARQFIKILPKTNVSEKNALINEIGQSIPVSRNVYGRAIGLQDRILEYFYEPLMKPNGKRARSQGKTSQVPLWTLKEQFINPKKDVVVQFQRDLGITEQKEVNVLPTEEQRSIIGQLLKGAARTLSQQVSLSAAQRNLEAAGASPQEIADVTAGQRITAFSNALKNPLDNWRLTYEHEIGILSESLYGRNVRIPLTDLQNYDKTGRIKKGVTFRSRNLNAIFDKETGETYREAAIRVVNTFLESHPQYRTIIRSTMTGGKKGGLFKFANSKDKKFIQYKKATGDDINFDDNIVDYPNVEQVGKKQAYNKSEKYSKDFHEQINSKEFKKENGLKLKELLGFFEAIEAHLQNYKSDIWLFEEMLLDTSKHMNTVTRILAPIYFYPIDPKTKKPIFNKKAVEEHTDPQNLIGKALLSGAFFNKLSDVWKVVGKSYMQGSILKVDDPGSDLKANMPKSYYDGVVPRLLSGDLKLPNGYSSIIRLAEAGVDPNAYMLINENKTIAEFFGVDGIINPETKLFDVKKQNEIIIKQLTGEVASKYGENIAKVKFSRDVDGHGRLNKARTTPFSKEAKGITVLDFDDTLATTKSLVKYTRPDGTTGTLNAEEYANTYEDLLDQDYTFDFSDFNKVVKGKVAPLFQKALKLQKKFGPENMFVLTARPPAAAKAIFDFLKANGLNIPMKNITGLANSTAEAKALWIADKVGEGYNDFYFADDALQNVQAVDNMLEQFDVKRKVQQAKVQFSKDMDGDFNNILEELTGIEAQKRFSDTKARKRGADKGKFRFFIPPSHEDFVGLLYNFMGKGRKGDGHRDFFEQALVRPLNRAYREIDTAKQAIANDHKSLNKQFPEVKNKLTKATPDGDFTFQDAIRVYLWNKHGYTIPGLSVTDQAQLSELVMSDPSLQAYAETLNVVSKQDAYVDPGPNWETGNIRIDLVDATGRVGRASYFTEFNENAEIIFSPENLNKIEAGYGKGAREALEDMLHRIKTGVNRPKGANAKPNMFMNWLNASVSGVMFFNTRSALLQQMSNVNYLNFADNNIYAAGKAFANQPQYWKDFAMIFNSDMLKQRRGGLQTDINGAEMAEAIKKARPGNLFDQVAIITGKALKLGFLPTQIGDNIAIATGGAAFYRNRVNKYIKDGMSVKEAEAAAFTDFQDITQSTQQSARPDMTSQQQASWVGKLILNFLNTPSQYNRIIKKAGLDIINRRITKPNTTQVQSDMSNMSRILYYGAAQNLIFYGLQTALFAVMFGLENDDEEKRAEQVLKKKERVINGAIDTLLRGSGIYGVAVSTIKNMVIKFLEQRDPDQYNKDEAAVLVEALNFSPVIGIRARSLVNPEKTFNYNQSVIKEMSTLDIDNPVWSAVTNYIQVAGFPANRIYQKTLNLRNAADNDYTALQRALFFSGYTTWSLNLGDTQKMKDIKETVKEKKKVESRERAKIKREEKKKEKEKENKSLIEENKKKKDGGCAYVNVSGNRCKNKAIKDGFCTIHEKTDKRNDGKIVQCRKRKADGTRCKMQTSNKSNYCYYHD